MRCIGCRHHMRCNRLAGAEGINGGINGGIKLSTTAHLVRQVNPRGIWVFPWRRLPDPGWGPGGRRFKSCLPDVRKAPLKRGFLVGGTRPPSGRYVLSVSCFGWREPERHAASVRPRRRPTAGLADRIPRERDVRSAPCRWSWCPNSGAPLGIETKASGRRSDEGKSAEMRTKTTRDIGEGEIGSVEARVATQRLARIA
jgi:hypothetical protein